MNIKVLLFGVTKDIVGSSTLDIQLEDGLDVEAMMTDLKEKYPAFNELNSLMIAVNSEYADKSQVLKQTDEIALIPPVSGG